MAANAIARWTGLFGHEELSEPKGFHRMAANAIARTEALLQEVAAAPPSLRTVCLLDEMSDTLCRVLDAAELCRNVHPNSGGGCATVRREFVDAANEAFVKLSTYVQALNSNQQLYRLLVAAIQAMPPAPAASSSSPPPGRNSRPQGAGRAAAGAGGEREEVLREAHRVAQLLRLDFERGGVHLPDGEDSCQRDSWGVPKRALSVTAGEALREAHRVAQLLRLDFERGGVHLPDDRREEVQRLTGEITHTSIEFNANIHSDSASIEVFPRSALHALPPNVHAMLQPIQRSKGRTNSSGSGSGSGSSSSDSSHNSSSTSNGGPCTGSSSSRVSSSIDSPHSSAGEGTEGMENVGTGSNGTSSSSSSSSRRNGSSSSGGSSGGSGAAKEQGYKVFSDPLVTSSVLKWVDDEEVRRRVYVLANASPGSNLHQLDRLIDLRSQLAKELSFPSYAHLINAPLMARTPDTVDSFLHNLGAQLTPKVFQHSFLHNLGAQLTPKVFQLTGLKKGFETSQNLRAQLTPSQGLPGDLFLLPYTRVCAWHGSAGQVSLFNVISSYFPLHACVRGMAVLVKSLFNAHLEPVPTAPGEAWAPDVTKFSLTHVDQGPLGFIYLDLHPRRGKFSHAAHFTIRCGRRKHLPLDSKGHLLPFPHSSTGSHSNSSSSSDGYQLPVVALVCNFAASSRSSPCLLAHHDVETLFHEFGHALHSLLSRTAFQHLSGTRAALDFVEVPSNLLEYFVWDHRFLGEFAVHHSTGEPIPRSLVDSLRASKSMLAASDLQTQVVYSLMDQAYFGVNPPRPTSSLLTPSLSSQAAAAAMSAGAAAGGGAGGGGTGGSGGDTTAVMADLMGRYMGVAHVPGTYWQSRFAHLTAYGAGE
ncbi:unnamed protein product [Closterium sp. NIES-64]|nr:unnamed protein product [Closterium sp. NIES-64]